MSNRIAIIGTAGRDKAMPMSLDLWLKMVRHATDSIPYGSHVVSGGAAWADHLAVVLFLSGHANHLTLHLPAPFVNGHFSGPSKSSGSAANYYHQLFSTVIGRNTLKQLELAMCMDNIDGGYEPAAAGYGGMFNRNSKVAASEGMLAYTFGAGDIPADGGTLDTWNKCTGTKHHQSLLEFI